MGNLPDKNRNEASRMTFPIRCVECGKKEVRPTVVCEKVKKNHDGRVYDLVVDEMPATKCSSCGETYYTEASDERIVAVLRVHLSLLTPEQIRLNLTALGMSQKAAAKSLGIAQETLSRWLTGAIIQSKAMDNLLRAYFDTPELREKLEDGGVGQSFGVTVRKFPNQPARLEAQAPIRHVRFIFLEQAGGIEKGLVLTERIRKQRSMFSVFSNAGC